MNAATEHTTTRPAVTLQTDPDTNRGRPTGREGYHVMVDGVHVARLSLISRSVAWRTARDTLPDDVCDQLADCLVIAGGDLTAAFDLFVTVGVGADHTFSKSTPTTLSTPDTDPSHANGNTANLRKLPLLTQHIRRDVILRNA